jgi:predicted transcriptional regulator
MTLKEIQRVLEAEIICGESQLDTEIEHAGASDLMSDALAFSTPGLLLITGLVNPQSVRTANIIEAKAIVYVRGRKPAKEGLDIAIKKGIPILSTKYMMYQACGLLYQHGLPAITEIRER